MTTGTNLITRAVLSPRRLTKRVVNHFWVSRAALRHAQETLFAEPPLLSVPEFEGVFRVGARSHLFTRLWEEGSYEPILAELCRRLVDPARDVLDVGANIGFFTVLAAKHTRGRVLAVEPTDNALNLLRQNIERNGVASRVLIFEGVASDEAGEMALEFVEGMEEYSSVNAIDHPQVNGRPRSSKTVAGVTLDQLVERHGLNPGFVKIDVEGAEHHVLGGASALLSQARPVLLSEFSTHLLARKGIDPQALLRTLCERGYRLIDPLAPAKKVGHKGTSDLLAVPEERYSSSELTDLLRDVHQQR